MTTIETVFVHPADQAEQRGTHYIEDSLSVYVMRDLDGADKWVLDPSVFGESLYTSYEKPETGNCQCDDFLLHCESPLGLRSAVFSA